MNIAIHQPAAVPDFVIAPENDADVAQRDAMLDRAMGTNWRRKSSEKLRRGRRPSEGLAFVARDSAGAVVGTVRLWDVTCSEGGKPALLLGPLAMPGPYEQSRFQALELVEGYLDGAGGVLKASGRKAGVAAAGVIRRAA